jgi:hypothetical protein
MALKDESNQKIGELIKWSDRSDSSIIPPWPANIIEKIVALAIGGNNQGMIIRLLRNFDRKKGRLKYEAMPRPMPNWKKIDTTRKIPVFIRAVRVTGSLISTL